MDGVSKIARVGQMLIGIVYVITGAIKVWDPVLFYWKTIPYVRMFGAPWEIAAAAAKVSTVLGPIEFALGLALLLNWYPRVCLPVAAGLMAFFTAITAWAWHLGASIDCGCFGALVERGPGEAAIEDGVMLVVLIFAWWRLGRSAQAGPPAGSPNWWGSGGAPVWPRARQIVGYAFVATLVVGGVRFIPELDRLEQSDLKSGVRLSGLTLKGVEVDLMEGEYLIELFSPTCRYCIDAVPKMNRLAQDSALPQLIALTSFPQDSEAMTDFKKRLQPRFGIATVSQTDFQRLTVGHGWPRLAYIKDGVVQQVWERSSIPTQARLREITGS